MKKELNEKNILLQIQRITAALITAGVSRDQNFPALSNGKITWSGYTDISFTLKGGPYDETYTECLKKRAYNYLLIDDAIIQMMYQTTNNRLVAHRLAFYPRPDIERYQDIPDEYEEKYYGDKLFVDVINRHIVAFPIRFDFDCDQDRYVQKDHPYSHLTLGNYTNCRIPVSFPLSPYRFIDFVLRNFYFDIYKKKFNDGKFACDIKFEETISKEEKQLMHIHYEINSY
ncbi:MAG: DUF2290 domain-containing protein [Nitrospirae bacterium]|nr:DUF2290 domain-containing protein [Nitrospirota bacterium]